MVITTSETVLLKYLFRKEYIVYLSKNEKIFWKASRLSPSDFVFVRQKLRITKF